MAVPGIAQRLVETGRAVLIALFRLVVPGLLRCVCKVAAQGCAALHAWRFSVRRPGERLAAGSNQPGAFVLSAGPPMPSRQQRPGCTGHRSAHIRCRPRPTRTAHVRVLGGARRRRAEQGGPERREGIFTFRNRGADGRRMAAVGDFVDGVEEDPITICIGWYQKRHFNSADRPSRGNRATPANKICCF